jgi:hypothetical protein
MQKILTTSILISLLVMSARAQSAMDTLTWKVDRLTDLNTANFFSYKCTFTTQGYGDITWVQGNGSVQLTLSVTTHDGDWPDVTVPGQKTFGVTLGEKSGTITFQRTSDDLFVLLDLSSSNGQKHQYHVYAIQPN